MQFGRYSKNYNCIPLPIILESKTKKELVDKIKSLKDKLYLITLTCETLENPTIVKMLKKCMLIAEKCDRFSQSTYNDEPLLYDVGPARVFLGETEKMCEMCTWFRPRRNRPCIAGQQIRVVQKSVEVLHHFDHFEARPVGSNC